MSKAAPTKTASAVVPASAAREKNIELAVSSITKQFGEGSIMRLGDSHKMKVETLSTGSLAVDMALGVGGLPKGRIIEIKLAPGIHTYPRFTSHQSQVWHN